MKCVTQPIASSLAVDQNETPTQAFCKECVVWMNLSHPNILQLAAVKIKPGAKKFSMISQMMKNGNVTEYISEKKANRICLVRPWVIPALWVNPLI